jgi:DNA primase
MIGNLLNRLTKVRRSGNNQWMACCPAHQDKTPSLSITDKGDGRILINCYAGCGAEDVLDSIGMTFEDIMPPKVIEHRVAPEKQKVYASDALKVIQLESRIVIMAAYELRRNKPMTEQDLARLELAMERINIATEMANV